MRLGVVIEQVVKGDHVDVGTRSKQRAVEVSTMRPKPLDTNTDGHDTISFGHQGPRQQGQ